jgi:hypothetical protein
MIAWPHISLPSERLSTGRHRIIHLLAMNTLNWLLNEFLRVFSRLPFICEKTRERDDDYYLWAPPPPPEISRASELGARVSEETFFSPNDSAVSNAHIIAMREKEECESVKPAYK